MKLVLTVGLLSITLCSAQVQLNEVLASNTLATPDIVDFEDYPDWLELKNAGGVAVNLAGYYLSDDPEDPYKWAFPATASIPANGYLLVMADGRDAVPGQVFPRGYWPWRDFTAARYHTNFALSASGETLLLSKAAGVTTTTLIRAAVPAPVAPDTAAVWKYKDDGSDQSTQWRANTFNDSAWASGPSELGYGNAPDTTVSYGTSGSNKHITTYFRHSFQVADPVLLSNLILKLLVDDGCVIYLNGTEVVRRNMPTGAINFKTLANVGVSGTAESTFYSYSIPKPALIAGDNVLAVEVHQVAANSSDLSLDLSLTADVVNVADGSLLDSVTYTQQVSDVSYGRDPAAPATWKQLVEPTAGAENKAAVVDNVRVEGSAVTASLAGGVHTGPQTVSLTGPAGAIHYTLNGAKPSSASPIFTDPLTFTTTTVLRARCFETGKAAGPILTCTYFIGETQGTLPYVSLVADPETLFGNTIGIYKNTHEPTSTNYGLSDVYKGKDAPGHVEFFAPGGTSSCRANCGIRIGGENNWVHPQKALNLAVRGKYGDSEIKYNLFPDEGTAIHTGLTLRDGGDRWANEMLRDCMWPKLAHGYLKVDTADYRPGVVFINGAYFGLHDLRERWDETWFAQKHQVPVGEVDHLLYGHITSSSVTLGVEKGDTIDWLDFMNFINTTDLTNAANWTYVESRVDMESFMDFVISESYGNNTSWFHNREFWKEKRPGAKWKWFLTDMDRTLSTGTTSGILADMLADEDVLKRFKLNAGFKQRLAQRYAAHMAATFTEARVQALMNQLGDEISAAEVARHQARWAPNGMTAATRAAGIAGTLTYATTRAGNVHAEIVAQLGVSAAVNLTLATTGSGSVLVEGIPVEPSTFKMFPNIPINLHAVAAPGYAFSGWTGATGAETTSLTLTGAQTVTAEFVPSSETIIGGILAVDTTLDAVGSPYVIATDVIVPPGLTLTIQAGVALNLAAGRNLRVQGSLIINGTAALPVTLAGRGGAHWGGISFENPTAPSALAHVIIRGATNGFERTVYPYAISGLNADLTLDFIDIRECAGPIFCRGGSTTLRDSILSTPYTGDCINVKQGRATTQRCTFYGNHQLDTDAIDYDGVIDGLIEDCRIYRFQASNCDGVDIGEGCVNVLIQRNLIYYNADKGFSVGQNSTVTIRQNLVVGCDLGVGVKDAGSTAIIDQNTFVNCREGVAVYEKNFGDGGGNAIITNTIISKATAAPVTVDALSTATISYSLSDTVPLSGATNLLADPRFIDPVLLNFQLQPTSPAINSGDPTHLLDPDLTVVDRGWNYIYQKTDYPFTIGQTVVINEILANSGTAADWIELHNRTQGPMDISGWFLSDDGTNLAKYRIPAGTVLPADGYVAFYEDLHFGAASVDPNKVTPFALSDVGETAYLSSAVNDELTDYQNKEDFGPSAEGETLGYYYKPSSDSYNFVAMVRPTPNALNSGPRVGPVVISELMYNPPGGTDGEEFVELLNVSNAPVILYDAVKQKPWRMTDGIDFDFPTDPPVTLAAGERILLVRSLTSFGAAWSVPSGIQKFQWTTGALDNAGETVQLAKPGGVDALNVTQYVRIDRVNYDDTAPWPITPDGAGPSLTKISETDYGNDAINWRAVTASPGGTPPGPTFATWAAGNGVTTATGDDDGDGLSNLMEYALGTNPTSANVAAPLTVTREGNQLAIAYGVNVQTPDVAFQVEGSSDLTTWTRLESTPVSISATRQTRLAWETATTPQRFYRLSTRLLASPAP
jgi:hypothetical protein